MIEEPVLDNLSENLGSSDTNNITFKQGQTIKQPPMKFKAARTSSEIVESIKKEHNVEFLDT